MSSIEIKICGKDYTVKSGSSSVDMEELAAFVDEKMKKLLAVKGKSSMLDVAVLTALNLGHELMELKQGKEGNDNQINQRLDGMIQKLKKKSCYANAYAVEIIQEKYIINMEGGMYRKVELRMGGRYLPPLNREFHGKK